MTREEKIRRGEEIIAQVEIDVNNHDDEEKRMYAGEVLHAFSPFTYDVPIPREDVAIALAEAEEQGKKLEFVPDMDEDVEIDGKLYKVTQEQYDGWHYKIVMV